MLNFISSCAHKPIIAYRLHKQLSLSELAGLQTSLSGRSLLELELNRKFVWSEFVDDVF
jgi:hypothetical protein